MRDKVRNTRHLDRFPRSSRLSKGSRTSRLYATRKPVAEKKKRAPQGALLVEVNLEYQQDGEPRAKRIHETLVLEGRAGDRMLEISVRLTEALIAKLVDGGLALGVE